MVKNYYINSVFFGFTRNSWKILFKLSAPQPFLVPPYIAGYFCETKVKQPIALKLQEFGYYRCSSQANDVPERFDLIHGLWCDKRSERTKFLLKHKRPPVSEVCGSAHSKEPVDR